MQTYRISMDGMNGKEESDEEADLCILQQGECVSVKENGDEGMDGHVDQVVAERVEAVGQVI